MKTLQINKNYRIKVYPPEVGTMLIDVIYTGKIQEKTLTQNEVHGFKGSRGTYLCTLQELKNRIRN
tara:strand:- start:239 stop:436 length:198 start_codon:yes stop_codon:yes gene_type:complete